MAERLSTGFADALNTVGSVKDIMANGVIHIYSGTQPTDADSIEAGTLLMVITQDSLDVVAGVATNGLNMGLSTSGILAKVIAEVWSGLGIADGTAGWFRWYDNDIVTGASTVAVRLDGAIGTTTSFEMQMSSTIIQIDSPSILSTFTYNTTRA